MTETPTPDQHEESIGDRVDRVETIIEQLETGEVSLTRAQELREEGQEILATLEADLDVGDGEISEQS